VSGYYNVFGGSLGGVNITIVLRNLLRLAANSALSRFLQNIPILIDDYENKN